MQKKFLFHKTAAIFLLLSAVLMHGKGRAQSKAFVLNTRHLREAVGYFNSIDTETVKNFITNDKAGDWLSANIPLFECPDSLLQQTYYYRWWTFRKHLKQTPEGFVFTEFITPVSHAGKYNTVSSALGHHIYEGRWLHDPAYIDEYISFWLFEDKKTAQPHLHAFSGWLQNAAYNRFLVNHDTAFIRRVFTALEEDYHQWEEERLLPNGLFWQYDVKDAMEESISGSRKEKNMRPTINSYMYGNAAALSDMACILGLDGLQRSYAQKAAELKNLVLDSLWDPAAFFFKVRHPDGRLDDAREELGYLPWYFDLPDDKEKYAKAWDQLVDTTGFRAPWGITTAERRHPLFRTHGTGHGCEWDGAVWPYATTQTLKGLSNLLTQYRHHSQMTRKIFYEALSTYARSHQKNGKPYLGEYQDEKNGYWLKGDNPRSSYYNHSCYADLVISDLIGLKPRTDDVVEIYPLVPENKWSWFCLDQVAYHGKMLTDLWDKIGSKYGKGKGFRIYSNGKQMYRSKKLKHVQFLLNP